MKDAQKICSECSHPIKGGYANAFHKLCIPCNQQRLIEQNAKRKVLPPSNIKDKYKVEWGGRNAGRTLEYVKRKTTGERELFLAIWMIKPHICTNCWCALGDEPLAHFFAHIKPKSTHPHLRLQPSNIMLLCYDCHYAYDHQGKEAFEKRKYKN